MQEENIVTIKVIKKREYNTDCRLQSQNLMVGSSQLMTVILVYVRKTEEIYRHGTGLQRFEEKNSNSDTDR